MKFPSILTPKKLVAIDSDRLAFEMREQIFRGTPEDGDCIFDSDFYSPNTLTNDGQASMLNVWARGVSAPNMWMLLLGMPAGGAPTKTTVLAGISESQLIGTAAYARQQVTTGDWAAPSLSGGDEEIVAAQKTFGPFTGNVPVSHVGLASIGSTLTGTFFLYVSTAYHTNNNANRVFVSGESYLVTLRDKQT